MNTNYSPFTLCCALLIFSFFRKIPVFYNKYVNYIASASLSVYLVTEADPVREVIHTYLNNYAFSAMTIIAFAIILYLIVLLIHILFGSICNITKNSTYTCLCNIFNKLVK